MIRHIALPSWAEWRSGPEAYTVGIEEELMLLEPDDWSLAQAGDAVLPALPPQLARHASAETHASSLELATGVHTDPAGAVEELAGLRGHLADALRAHGLRAACAGTHPFTTWRETITSGGDRYRTLYATMRELARREPTFSLHVHVGVPHPEDAVRAMNRLRDDLPLLLALSASSPFWQGRDTGLASARTSLFQAFPRVGMPRPFRSYAEYVETVDGMIRCGAVPEPTFLWWDVRLQPRFGTIEVRVMDAQPGVERTHALLALARDLVRRAVEDDRPSAFAERPEMLAENRFLAARDGVAARFIDPWRERLVPVSERLEAALDDGCAGECPDLVRSLVARPAPDEQRAAALRGGVRAVVAELAARHHTCRRTVAAPA